MNCIFLHKILKFYLFSNFNTISALYSNYNLKMTALQKQCSKVFTAKYPSILLLSVG